MRAGGVPDVHHTGVVRIQYDHDHPTGARQSLMGSRRVDYGERPAAAAPMGFFEHRRRDARATRPRTRAREG